MHFGPNDLLVAISVDFEDRFDSRDVEQTVTKLEAAIKEYRKVLAENPNDANTLNRVGDLYARIDRFDEEAVPGVLLGNLR